LLTLRNIIDLIWFNKIKFMFTNLVWFHSMNTFINFGFVISYFFNYQCAEFISLFF
jgi:hypothetical protein